MYVATTRRRALRVDARRRGSDHPRRGNAAFGPGSSRASVALNTIVSASRSDSIPISTRTTIAFAAATACDANAAMRPASRSTNASISSAGSTRLTQPPSLRGRGVDVVAAEHHFERTAATDRARQPHRATCAGDDADHHLGLVEDCVRRGKAHVAGQRQFAPTTTDTTCDHGDRRLRHRAQRLAHLVVGADLVGSGCSRGNCWIASTSKYARNHSGFADRITTARTDSSCATSLDLAPPVEEHLDRDEVDRRVVDHDRRHSSVVVPSGDRSHVIALSLVSRHIPIRMGTTVPIRAGSSRSEDPVTTGDRRTDERTAEVAAIRSSQLQQPPPPMSQPPE